MDQKNKNQEEDVRNYFKLDQNKTQYINVSNFCGTH